MLLSFTDSSTPVSVKESMLQLLVMRKINSPKLESWMLTKGHLTKQSTITEFGIFSFLILDSEECKITHNQNHGMLVRTKSCESNEGGVSSGYAVIDFPIVIDSAELKNTINHILSKIGNNEMSQADIVKIYDTLLDVVGED